MKHMDEAPATQVVIPVGELHGRTVWSESGERIGVVRGVHQDDEGRVVALDVRERWMLGPHHEVPASGMRMDDGDIIVAASATPVDTDRTERTGRTVQRRRVGSFALAPVLLAGREGARERFGGLDIVGSLFGALVTIASLVLVGGVLAAIFGSDAAVAIDTSLDSLEAVTTEPLLIAAATIFVSFFLGGWAAGRSARFDGPANGVVTVVWVLAIGVALGTLGAVLGEEYDVFANNELPTFATDEFALWGSAAFAVTLVLMLIGGALGGALGESWHRRADRSMLDVVSVDDRAPRPVDDGDAVPVERSDRDPR